MELPSDELMSVPQALTLLDSAPLTPRVTERGLYDAAGSVLAEPIQTDRDFPAFDKSLLDGFAVRLADVQSCPVELKLAGEVSAGVNPSFSLQNQQAVAIMTGAPIPPGTEAVVPVEQTQMVGEGMVRILKPPKESQGIARRGSDRSAGEVILRAGVRLGPAQVGAAAAVGAVQFRAYDVVRVGILSTGNEIIPHVQTPGPTQLRDSNSPMLFYLVEQWGGFPLDLGHAADDPNLIHERIETALTRTDVLFVSGGMSMGKYDFVPRILKELGFESRITKLRVKPGKPFVFAQKTIEGEVKTVFGLPGNPVSAFVCATRLASRVIRRLQGLAPETPIRQAKLLQPLPANGPREFYQPAVLSSDGLQPLQWKGSADLFTLAQANALLIRPENAPALSSGEPADFLEIP